MRNYELTYILRSDLDEEALAATVEKFTNLIKNNGGESVEVEKWGKRRLAYTIDKNTEGYYYIVNYKGEPATSHEAERVLKISDEVIRHLVIRKEE
ncbi:MAG: 30S ribosomal protein S6 [Firmicutes bacterium]|nr:30S ribosomal protein S6 [Bacillota bacterium]